jgi:pyrroline-5-carboxylate reductase
MDLAIVLAFMVFLYRSFRGHMITLNAYFVIFNQSMPNTPSMIGEGMTVWCCTSNLSTGDRNSISKLLNTFGKAIYVDDEKFVDMSTAISGSGPACKWL